MAEYEICATVTRSEVFFIELDTTDEKEAARQVERMGWDELCSHAQRLRQLRRRH